MSSHSRRSSLAAVTFKAQAFDSDLSNFLLGAYSTIYLCTLYQYLTNTSFKHRVVIGAMSLLYLSCLSNSILEWYLNGVRPIDIEGTHVVILDPVFPRWTTLFGQINFFSMAFIADVLMIWRCYNVWNCSVRSILLSSFLVVCESIIFIAMVAVASIEHLNPTPTQADLLNILVGTIYLLSAATTLVTTVSIAYRINNFCQEDLLNGSLTRYKHVVDILIQSAVVYSPASAVFAIVSIIPKGSSVVLYNARNYTSTLYIFTAGAAPTIMVARVISSSNSTASESSGIQFHHTEVTTEPSHFHKIGTSLRSNHSSLREPSDLDTKV